MSVGLLSFGAAPLVFNGGKSQTNFNFLGQGEFPFLNLLKEGGTWKYVSNSVVVTPSDLNSTGYPTAIKNSGSYFVTFLPSQLSRPGNYVLTCSGNGSLYIGSTATAASYSVVTVSKSAQAVFQLTSVTGAPLKVGQEFTASGATSTGGWNTLLNKTHVIVSIDVTGLLVTTNTDTTSASTASPSGTITATNTLVVTQGTGRYVFTPAQSGGSFNVGVTGTNLAASTITDMKLYHIDDEADVLAGKTFGNQFKAKLRAANFGVYRNLNWPNMNTSHVTTWATRRPIAYPTYNSIELRASIYCPTVSVSGAAITVTGNGVDIPASGGPTDRMTFSFPIPSGFAASRKSAVTFTSGSPGSVTWTSNGFTGGESVTFAADSGATLPTPLLLAGTYYVLPTGLPSNNIQISLTPGGAAINLGSPSGTFTANVNPEILLNGTTRLAVGDPVGGVLGNSNYPSFAAGDLVAVVYDATFGKYLLFGGGTNGSTPGIDNGVPPEVFFNLCVEMGAHPYWVTPYLAGDPMTDWLPSLMQYHVDHAPAWMIPRFEGTNETWNTAGGFSQTTYAINRGAWYGWSTSAVGYHNYYGKLMSVIGQAGAKIFGGANLGTKYHVLCGVQTSLFTALPITSQNPRVTSALYVTGGVAQAPLSGSWGTITFTAVAANTGNAGATSLVSHACCAQYTSPSVRGTLGTPNSTENALAATYNGNWFTGSITGSILTVATMRTAGVTNGTGLIAVGDTLFGTGVPNGVTILSLGTGVGAAGTYNLSSSVPTNITSQDFVTAADLRAAADYIDTLTGTNVFATNDFVLAVTANVRDWASGLGVKNVCGYEGCYSPDYQGTDSSQPGVVNPGKTQIDLLRWGGKNIYASTKYAGPTGGLQKITSDLLTGFAALSGVGSNLKVEFPSNYLVGGGFPSTLVWSVLEDVYTTRPSPQWDAHTAFNN